MLVIIGYGGRDQEVNRIISECFDFKNKPTFVVNSFAGESVEELVDNLEGTLIDEHLENLRIDDKEAWKLTLAN